MKDFKDNLLGNITLIIVLVCTIVHLLILTLNVFGALDIVFYNNFNYLIAYFLIILSLAIYIASFFITKWKKLNIPAWFQVVFYIAFFLFTNTYYATNAYNNIFALIFFFAYLSFVVSIINVSVFYNVQKDENNKLKASKKYITTSIFFYSIGTNALIEVLISMYKSFFLYNYMFDTLEMYIVEFCTMLLVTIIMCVMFSISLSKSKRFINKCLIKTINN